MTTKINKKPKISQLDSIDAYKLMKDILLREEKINQKKQHFWMVGLSSNTRILFIELISMGSVKFTTVEPMNVFRIAVLKGAEQVILVRNRPNGDLSPTTADKDLIGRLIQVGRILNIQVVDHLIISTQEYISFADTGLIEELEKSAKWAPQFNFTEKKKAKKKKL